MLLFFALVGVVSVVGVGHNGSTIGVVFAQADAPKITPDQVNVVAREIWCPLCSGVRLDVCELKACEQMREMIAIKLAEGEDTQSIKAYFLEQYGPQVLGEPPREGFNWLAWILPAVALVVGGYFFWRATQRMMAPVARLEANTELAKALSVPITVTENQSPAVDAQLVADNALESLDDEDEYTQKLEEELAKYG